MLIEAAPLKSEAIRLGFDLVGVCPATRAPHLDFYKRWLSRGMHGTMDYLARQVPLKASPEAVLPGAKSIIAVGLNYYQSNEPVEGEPHIARYALGRDYHKVIRGKLRHLSRWLEQRYPNQAFRPCVDSAPIFERDYAHLAGLGWFGKNTCLIDSKRGSWFFIGLLITTMEIEPDRPAIGGCGTCTKCIDSCPTGAIVQEDGRWQVDSRSCISYLTIEHRGELDGALSRQMGDWTFGCDICQEVCPFNVPRASQPLRAQTTAESDFLETRQWPHLSQLAQIGEEQWDVLTAGSPVRRTGISGLRRNARINLQNEKL